MEYLLFQPADRHAIAAPDRVAFRCASNELTYADFAKRTNQLAHLLLRRGVARGHRVGVYLGRSLETAVAVHGILKAGAAFVPLDPDAPPERTRRLIEDCGIHCLISATALKRKLPDILTAPTPIRSLIGAELKNIVSFSWSTICTGSTDFPRVNVLEDDLAYIMYTSGSTGEPKGIMHTHRSGMAYARLSATLYDVQPTDVVGNHCALHYDISTFGYFSAPLAGATTLIVTDAHTKFPLSLFELILREAITIWYSVPLALLQLLAIPGASARRFPQLRWILFGGEVMAPHHLRSLMQIAPNARASNVYGPAEVNQCTYRHFSVPPVADIPLPLGAAWDNTEVLIVDEQDREVPVGSTGELLVRSATCMWGYWNRPELTERAFYYREITTGLRQRFYRTGDLVYRNGDGELAFSGRKDRQVKVRGHRVELEEVEALLNSLEGVSEAAVYLRQIRAGEATVAALVVAEPGSVTAPKKWRAALAQRLPTHCLPDPITVVSALPRSNSGKIDRLTIHAHYST